jgi:Mg2+/Co2+ transporter CorB
VIHEARVIPEIGASYDVHGFNFQVVGKEGNRVTRLRVTPLPPAADEPA